MIASSLLFKKLAGELVMVEKLTDEHERHLKIAKQVLKSAGIKVEAISQQGEVVPVMQ
ncbi:MULTISPECIES: hypothetical protein [unclassified Aeromonas]|uniref:hypothetical protein n=1 Tax=unclassified Aeromonas TaxID=257493 RepID=UPI0014961638|nr:MULTISPECIES: hypothetical protein [unclassified Aeromonas]